MNIQVKNIILPALLATAIASCTIEEGGQSSAKFDLRVNAEVERYCLPDTRVDLYNTEDDVKSKVFYLYGWKGNYEEILCKKSATVYESGSWKTESTAKIEKHEDYKFYAYSKVPDPITGLSASVTDAGISVDVTDITTAQEDILLGAGAVSSAESGAVNINFSHPFASVIIEVGEIDNLQKVTEVSLSGLALNGTTSMSESSATDGNNITKYEWTGIDGYTAKLETTGLNAKKKDTIAKFVVVPQNLSANKSLMIIKYIKTDNSTGFITKIFDSGKWEAGYTTRYIIGFGE